MDIGSFHPVLVHFPVVFFTLTVVLDMFQYFFFDKRPSYFSHWLFFAGAAAIVPTIITGLVASNTYAETVYIGIHQALAFFLSVLIFVQVVIRISLLSNSSIISSKYVVFLSFIIFLIVSLTGDVGGILARGSSPFSQNGGKKTFDYNSADPVEVRSYTPEKLRDYLISKIDLLDVLPLFEKHGCIRCHADKFQGQLPTKFSVEKEDSPTWLPRDKDNKLINWPESPFYRTVVLLNRMPIDAEKNSQGISWSERLLLIRWLEHNAPTELPL